MPWTVAQVMAMTADSPNMTQRLLDSIDQQTRLAGHNRLALLLFRVSKKAMFGINVFKVLEVMRRPEITWMPGANAIVRGVADVRGRVIPVLDLGRLLNVDEPDCDQYLIVTEYNRSLQGFLVGSIERIVHLDVSQVEPPGEDSRYLTAVTRVDGKWVQILDVEQVLADVAGGPPKLSEQLKRHGRAGDFSALVVDDSRIARTQVGSVLSELGVSCISLADGKQGIDWLLSQAESGKPLPDLVVSDIEMPHMDGYTMVTEIRRNPLLRDLYVILHTSLSGHFNRAMVERVGANDFIAKFAPDELANAVLKRISEVSPG